MIKYIVFVLLTTVFLIISFKAILFINNKFDDRYEKIDMSKYNPDKCMDRVKFSVVHDWYYYHGKLLSSALAILLLGLIFCGIAKILSLLDFLS